MLDLWTYDKRSFINLNCNDNNVVLDFHILSCFQVPFTQFIPFCSPNETLRDKDISSVSVCILERAMYLVSKTWVLFLNKLHIKQIFTYNSLTQSLH